MSPPPALPSDRQLVDAARRGDNAAWAELLQRHRIGVERVTGSGRSAARRVDEALALAERRLVRGASSPADAADTRAVRPALISALTDGFYGPAWPGVLSDSSGGSESAAAVGPPPVWDDEVLAVAFATLPEPWQTALWHRWVERDDQTTISPYVGRSPDEVDDLIATARRGLIDAFIREYQAAGPFRSDGAGIVPLLAGYANGTLSDEQRLIVDTHLRNDRIAVADPLPAPPAPAPPGGRSVEGPAALAPPTLRRHDAVDSRRLLELFRHLDTRFSDAIAPGVLSMPSDPANPVVPPVSGPTRPDHPVAPRPTPGDDDAMRGRRLAAVVASLVVVLAVIAGLVML